MLVALGVLAVLSKELCALLVLSQAKSATLSAAVFLWTPRWCAASLEVAPEVAVVAAVVLPSHRP